MPDVKMWYDSDLSMSFPEETVIARLREIVAGEMSCFVPSEGEGSGSDYYQVTAQEIDVTVFEQFKASTRRAVIEIAAYSYPNRMQYIKARLRRIAFEAADLLGVEPGEVSISFIPVLVDCWTTGAATN